MKTALLCAGCFLQGAVAAVVTLLALAFRAVKDRHIWD